jgi:hypothetical protein
MFVKPGPKIPDTIPPQVATISSGWLLGGQLTFMEKINEVVQEDDDKFNSNRKFATLNANQIISSDQLEMRPFDPALDKEY